MVKLSLFNTMPRDVQYRWEQSDNNAQSIDPYAAPDDYSYDAKPRDKSRKVVPLLPA